MGNTLDVTSKRMLSEIMLEKAIDLKRHFARAIINRRVGESREAMNY